MQNGDGGGGGGGGGGGSGTGRWLWRWGEGDVGIEGGCGGGDSGRIGGSRGGDRHDKMVVIKAVKLYLDYQNLRGGAKIFHGLKLV
ncbi:hypothetical protein L3X38_029038 [Prunus dulcis]|uniref:Uncharacterized protein n=1 Tax=Prunus dulcis TaxID=3755 RepID=A0AAD4VTC6_PRUDU|nr:hypothetical protein L3X38_029038 [Prunus dulcis]